MTKTENLIINWLEGAENLNIREIDRFVSGIKRDIEGVKNSIKLEYNNGLAEGCINKLKTIKRIMYGKSSFNTLRTKILKLENLK